MSLSEYIELTPEEQDDPTQLIIYANIRLTADGTEQYDSADAMEEGSPLAQALSFVGGITKLRIEEHELHLTRNLDYEWFSIVEDVRSLIIDFFL